MATYAFPEDTREADFWLLNGLDYVWFSKENYRSSFKISLPTSWGSPSTGEWTQVKVFKYTQKNNLQTDK